MKSRHRLLLNLTILLSVVTAYHTQLQAQCGLFPPVLSSGSQTFPNGLCTPVSVNMEYRITFGAPLAAGPTYVLVYDWGDGTPTTNVIVAAGSASYTITRPHNYPANSDCEYKVNMFMSANGGGACGTTRQSQLVTTWRTDAFNGGNIQLISPITGNNVHTVCEGVNISVIFDDQSIFNCNSARPANYPPNSPIVNPNEQVRWQQIVYNTPNGAPRIPNVRVDGVLMPAGAGSNYQDPRGVSFYTPPPVIINDPRRRDALVVTAPGGFTAGFPVVGDEFEVTIRYWNFCNPYANDFDLTPVGGDVINGDNPPVEATAIIRIIDSPTPPVVPNRDICSGDPRTLTVTAPVGGQTYKWWTNAAATISAGPDGTSFTPTSAQAPAGQRTHFWVTTEVGPALGSCRSAPTEVTLLRRTALTSPTPISGPTNLCPNTSYTFSVPTGSPPNPPDITITDPIGGNVILATDFFWTVPGSWTINSGQNTNSINITTGAVAGGTVSVVNRYETAPLCPSSPATSLAVNVRARPTVNITPDPVDICEGTAVAMNGNPSASFGTITTHTWGGSTAILDATNIFNPNILATAAPGSYNLTYFISADFGGGVFCSSAVDNVNVDIAVNPTPSDAGPPQSLCTAIDGFTATMNASPAAPGIGTWVLVSTVPATLPMPAFSNINSRVSTVTIAPGNEGAYTFAWDVVNLPCTSTDNVVIDFGSDPTNPAAGVDQFVCAETATLAGNAPIIGSGFWSVVSGPGACVGVGCPITITTPTSPTSGVTLNGPGFTYGAYTLRWTITSGTCPAETDDVIITFNQAATVSAMADFTACLNSAAIGTPIPLNGTVGGGATQGQWQVVTGNGSMSIGIPQAGPNINNSYIPVVADFAAGTITVRLVALDPDGAGPTGPCVSVNDDVVITKDLLPTAAAAGADFATCAPITNLAATAANNGGTGTWSIGNALYYETFTYPNGTGLSGPNPHASSFTHASGWTITAPDGNTLLANDDYMRVESNVMEGRDFGLGAELVWRSPSININAQPNVTVSIQLAESGTMDAAPLDYIRAFYRLNGAGPEIPIGNIDDDAAVDGAFSTFTVSGITGTSLEVIVRVFNDAAAEFHRFDNVFVSSAGASLPLIADINNPTSSVSNLPVGATTFNWTVTSALGVCSSSTDPVVVTRHASPDNNPQTPALCEDVPTGGTATVTLAFLTTLNDFITGIAGSTGRTVQFFTDPARTLPYPASLPLANTDVVYTRVTRTDVVPGCVTDGTVTFTINSRPAALDQNPEFCEDQPVGSNTRTGINLTTFNNAVKNNVAANTVAWFSDAALTVPVPVPTNVTANNGTSFFARVTDINGCTDDAEVEISLNPIPPPNALIGPSDVCVDPSAVTLYQLTVNNVGYTYTWSIPNPPFDQVLGGGVNDFLVLLSFPVLGSDILSVVETSDKGCVGLPNTQTITIDTSPPPITIVGPATVCEGEAGVVYNVANLANTTYAWTVPAGSSIIAGQGTFEITVNFGTIPGLISVVPTTTTGCAGNPDDHAVAINPNPSLDVLANSVCSDTQAGITLSGTGAATFNITSVTVPPGLSPVARATGNGFLSSEIFGDIFTNTTGGNLIVQYSVVPVSAAGCPGTAGQVNLTVRPEPTLAPNLTDVICSTVDAVSVPLVVATGSVAADLFQITAINNPSGLTAVAGAPALGTFNSVVLLDDRWENLTGAVATIEYFIRPINSITTCVGDPPLPVTVTVNPEPQVTSPTTETICSGSSPSITLTSSLGPTSSFTWTVKSITGFISGASNGTGPAITNVLINNDLAAGTVTYEVRATGPAGLGSCDSQPVDVVITVDPSPIANLITQIVCSDAAGGNTFTQNLQLLENSVNNTGTVSFSWFQDAALTIPIVAPALNAYVLTNNVPVFVEVDNGQCQKAVPVTFTVNPTPSINTSVTSSYNGAQISCTGASDGQITAVPANGTSPYQFSIDGGGSFFNSAIFNGLSVAGNPYVIRVRDINGCTEDSAPLSLIPPPALSPLIAITSNYNGEDVSCQAASDGIVTITPAGGTGTYTFQLLELPSNTTGDATGVYTGLRAGTYTFIVKDANNCQFTFPVITLTEPTPVTASAVLTSPVSCNGNSDGVITVTGAGGTLVGPNYQFTLIQAPFTVNTTGVFSGLAAGNYTVNVEDDNGCVRTSNTVSVTQPSVLTAFASVTSNYNGAKISCFGASDAQVTAIANGGNGGYSFVLDQDPLNVTGAADGSFENLGPGNYSITVTDAGGCSVTSLLVNVTEPIQIAASALVTGTISCNGGSDGQITVSASGGTGAYSFEQINPAGPTNVSGIFSGLAQGTYDFEVTDLNGCSDIVQLTISEPTVVTASAAVTSNYNGAQISCNGANNGVITVTGAGGTGSLQYVFDQFVLTNTTGQFTGVFTGVPAGAGYTFTVRDSKNCTVVTLPIGVTQPTVVTASGIVSSNFNGEDISCVGASDGAITAAALGGTGAYTYTLDQVPSNTSGDASGIYTGVSAGIYTITARDVNNCFIVTAPITITPPPALTATAVVTSNYNGRQVSCNGASDGIITVTPGGGVPGYTYVLSPAVNVTGAASGVFTGLPAGSYTVTVTDLNGCQRVTTSVTISEPAILAATSTVTSNFNGQQISCNGASDGTIQVSPVGGTIPYSYVLVEIPGNVTGAASGIFTGIPAGTYTFNVLDVNNCPVTTAPVTITPPTPVIASAAVTSNYNGSQISCFGLSDGVITVTASGGTGVLQYTFDQLPANTTGQFSGIFTGIPAGVGYTFTVRDANTCTVVTGVVNVSQPVAIGASGVVSSNYNGEDISCVGSSDGIITITANNGTGAYTYKLDQAPSNTSGDLTGVYTGLSAGTYTVTARDANNCFVITAPIIITSPPALTATAAVTSNYNGRQISCNGASDGVITVTAGGGVGGFNYVLTPPVNVSGAATGVFTGLPAGSYTITITDLNNCQRTTTTVTISEPAIVAATAAITSNYNGEDVSCNGASDGIIRVTPTGGTTPYAYTFVEIPANVSGAATGIFTGIPAGTYTFNVLDVNNCPVTTAPITISEPAIVVASAAVTSNYNGSQISCNGINDGVITITSSGGTGDATYVFDQFAVTNQSGRFSGVFTSVPAGTGYTFTVTDANGCQVVTAPIDVVQPGALNATGLATSDFNGFDVRCFTETNGQITVTASGGNGAHTYMLLEDAGNVTGIATGIFDNLRAGSFRARITDVNGCLFTTTPIIVTQPNNLTITINKTSNYNGFDVSCIGATDGEVSVITTAGGAGGYVYALDGFPGNVSGVASGVFTGVASGLYTITVTDVNTCTRQSLPVILTDPLPLFEGIIGLDKSICLGADPTAFTQLAPAFGGIGNYVYQWRESTDGVLFSNVLGANSATFDPPAVPVTTFYKRQITSGTCTTLESNTVTVTVNPLPTATLVPSKSPVCEGDFFLLDFTFTGQAPFYFDYNDGTTFTNDRLGAANTPVPVLNYANTTTYTVTEVRDFNGCVAPVLPAPVTVPVIRINPAFAITSPAAQCSGGQFDFEFTVDPDVEYTWIWGDGQTDVISADPFATGAIQSISHTYSSFNTSGTTNFPVILTAINNVNGCGPKQTNQTIQIFPNILINLFPNKTEICGGDQVTFTNPTAGGSTHHWFYREQGVVEMRDERTFVAASSQTFLFNNTTLQNPIIYELVYEVSNANCAADTVIEITVYREVAASFNKTTPVPQFIGGIANMTFTNTSIPIDGVEFQYDWDFGTAASQPPVSGVGPFNFNYTSPGTKTVNLLATNLIALANGLTCTDQYQETFNILLPPLQAGFEYTPQAVCFPANISITGNLATGDVFTWRLVDGTGRQLLISNDTLPTFNISSPGRYTIFLTTTNTLTGQSASADNTGSGNNILAGNPADASDFDTPIDIYENPFAGFEARPNVVYVPDTQLQTFNFSSSPIDPETAIAYPIEYKWYFGDGTDTLSTADDPENFEPNHFYQNEGVYDIALLAINDHGNGAVCIDTATRTIQAKAAGFTRVPNAFTPSPNGPTGGAGGGGNSVNDVFLPVAKGIVDFQMQIYDRWGNLIFESKDKTIGWDGYDRNGNLLPAGVYVYKLVLRLSNDQRTTQIGDVTLIR